MNIEPIENPESFEEGPQDIEKKIRKVVLEYDDGTINYLAGDEAEAWSSSVSNSMIMDWVHGGRQPDFNWKSATAAEAAELFK